MGLTLHVMGCTYIELDGKRLVFSLRKAESIIFYAALSGQVTREHLKAVFWSDKSETLASANLRNALYIIRNAIPENLTAGRREISIVDFSLDIDAAASAISDPDNPIPPDIFDEPLKGIAGVDSEEFDAWITHTRAVLREKTITLLKARISACYERNMMDELICSFEALLRIDFNDEDSVLELMEVYLNTGRAVKAIQLYNSYLSELRSKLGIYPSERASSYFKKIINSGTYTDEQPDSGDKFWCRRDELAQVVDTLTERGRKNAAVYIYGEAGIGKTSLINKALSVLDTPGTLVLYSRSCAVGEGYPYSPWNNIMRHIGQLLEDERLYTDPYTQSVLSGIFPGFLKNKRLNYNADVTMMTDISPVIISGMIANILRMFSADRKIVIVFEDIHWFDRKSLELMTAILSEEENSLKAIISGRPESSKAALSMLHNLSSSGRLNAAAIQLGALSGDEIIKICSHSLPESTLKQKGEDYFIRESEGIPLLLFEILRALSENPSSDCTNGLGGLIMGRIGELTQLQKDILMVISVFGVGAEPTHIAEVLDMEESCIIPAVEELISKSLISEKSEDERIVWDFIHVKVRDCVYDSISLFKRQELHRKAAEVLSRLYSPNNWNPNLSSMLCHHYVKSGQKLQELHQYVCELILDITLNHDLFPVVLDKVLLSCSAPFSSREETELKIKRALSILDEISASGNITPEEYAKTEAACFELVGAYHLSWGEYESGMVYIRRAIKTAMEYGLIDTHIYCLKHICYMYLQTENAPKLLAAAKEFLLLAKREEFPHYIATAVRFIGMSWFILGDYDKAEKIFNHSIRLFEQLRITNRSYTLGMLVAKCYIGEIYQLRGDYDTALSYFDLCVEECENIKLYWGRSYFHAHAANLALDMKDMSLLFCHIDKGTSLFESFQGGRCGSMLYSLKAIADAERGDIESALVSLEYGDILLKSVARKLWIALQYMAKARVLSKINGGGAVKNVKSGLLSETEAEYAAKAARFYRECGMEARAVSMEKSF